MDPEINIKSIPQYQLDRLSGSLVDVVRKYFEDPEVQKEFEAWKRNRQKSSTDQSA